MKILTISMFITLLSSSVFAKKFTPESEEQNKEEEEIEERKKGSRRTPC